MRLRVLTVIAFSLSACRVGEVTPTAPGTPGGAPVSTTSNNKRTEPSVRIGIKIDTAAVFITTSAASPVTDKDGNVVLRTTPNDRWTFTADATGAITARNSANESVTTNATPLMVRPADDAFITIGDKAYRGAVLLRTAGSGRLSAINVLAMENYLLGVVPFEIGRLPAAQIEAIKAQAIAARTYAVGNMNGREALGFDFYATVADQVYGGASGEDTVVSRAVRETAGEIITQNGRPILAYYSSTCGGHTADVDESWPWRPPQPYLKGKPDTDANGEAYCKTSSRFRWAVSWSGDSLRTVLQQTLAQRLANPAFRIAHVEDVVLDGHSKSGRAQSVSIKADGMTYRVPADSIRWVLRPTPLSSLNSSLLFDLNATKDNGEVTRLEVRGGGWGHGVGMCQVGAINRAKAGQSYREILAAYYSDTDIQRLY